MTRETKVGLVIAGSFLCLVGVVVSARMRKAEDPEREPIAQTVSPRTEHEQEATDKKAKGKAQDIVPADHKQVKPSEIPPQGIIPNPDPDFPGLPDLKPPPVIPPPLDEKAKTEEDQKEKLKALELAKGDPNPPKLPGNPFDVDKTSSPPPPLETLGKNDPLKVDSVLPPPPKEVGSELKKEPDPLDLLKKAEPNPLAPPPELDKLDKKVIEPKVVLPPVKEVKVPDPLPVIPPPLGTIEPPPPKDFSPPLIGTPAKKDDFIPVPAIGSEPKVSSPPINIGPSTLPKVKAFDVFTYECQAEDLSFATVSQRYFRSDKYAEALLQYNRDHFLGKAQLQANPSLVKAGQKIYIPPADILEAKYAKLIGAAPQPGFANPPLGSVPPLGSAPQLKTNFNGQDPLIGRPTSLTPAPAATKDPTKSYRVPAQGQHILEISRQTLGDIGRWTEIRRLNPTLGTSVIPGGTEVLLPASANVP